MAAGVSRRELDRQYSECSDNEVRMLGLTSGSSGKAVHILNIRGLFDL